MDETDVIIVGAGLSGIISAISLVNDGLKVLLLEKNNNVGGASRSIVKGRFEFELSINNLYINNSNDSYLLKNIIMKNNIHGDIEFSKVLGEIKIICQDKEYVLPFGINNFINKVCEYVPNSWKVLRTFFDLACECKDAMNYIFNNLDNLNYEYIKNEYNNFMHVASYSLSKVLDTIEMSDELQQIVNSLWIYLGSPETEISFLTYAMWMYDFIDKGICIPTYSNYDVVLTLLNDFLEKGGKLKLNSEVVKLLIDDGKINGVKLDSGKIYYANYVIVNSSLMNVYTHLINSNELTDKVLKNINRRKLGARLFQVHLGLNKSALDLGINNYTYLIYPSLDSDVSYAKMKDLNSDFLLAICLNLANEKASPEGTCILTLNTLYFDDCFEFDIERDDYNSEINNLARHLIEKFEEKTKIVVSSYIEEMEICSPVDNYVINNSVNGAIYDFKMTGLDNMLPRILNANNENYVNGLYVCGGFDGDLYAYNSSYVSGLSAANKIKKDMAGEKK